MVITVQVFDASHWKVMNESELMEETVCAAPESLVMHETEVPVESAAAHRVCGLEPAPTQTSAHVMYWFESLEFLALPSAPDANRFVESTETGSLAVAPAKEGASADSATAMPAPRTAYFMGPPLCCW
jgi:hypothetical protein